MVGVGSGVERNVDELQKPYEETLLCLDLGSGPMNLHVMKSQQTCDKSARIKWDSFSKVPDAPGCGGTISMGWAPRLN